MTFIRSQSRALLALPLLLALAVAASGQRVVDLWWPYTMHAEVALDAGGTAHFETTVETQSNGRVPLRLSVRHVSTEPVQTVRLSGDEEVPVPAGFDAWRVRVHVEADPAAILGACQVLLRDTEGREYIAGTRPLEGGALDLASCQPPDAENPSGLDMDADRTSNRPPAYDRDAVFLLPEGAVPVEVRVSPDLHLYGAWPLPAAD